MSQFDTGPSVSAAFRPRHRRPDQNIQRPTANGANLTMRMSIRRFTRLTKAFSKKLEEPRANGEPLLDVLQFGRMHQTLHVTPARTRYLGLRLVD
jgi:hypothetical protein